MVCLGRAQLGMVVFDQSTGVPEKGRHLTFVPLSANIVHKPAGSLGHGLTDGFKAYGVVCFLGIGFEKIAVEPIVAGPRGCPVVGARFRQVCRNPVRRRFAARACSLFQCCIHCIGESNGSTHGITSANEYSSHREKLSSARRRSYPLHSFPAPRPPTSSSPGKPNEYRTPVYFFGKKASKSAGVNSVLPVPT